jgi:pimeloyl-ACP methyl ester carboxylesterase
MEKAILYIHGKGGNPKEAEYYKALFKEYDVVGFDYFSQSPWEAKKEFPELFDHLCGAYKSVTIIANSIGAFFTMSALADRKIEKAYFISPVVDMESLIQNMMQWANVTEDDLQKQKEIPTSFGETLSWEYLCYVREHPVAWTVPTNILYGEKDSLTSYETISAFADRIGAALTVMENGEHWFHTKEQMEFLSDWIKK